MKRYSRAVLVLWVLMAGCVYYPPAPGYYVTGRAGGFDRCWAAAVGAFRDQGIRITVQDKPAGYLRGRWNGVDVSAEVRTQADGSVRVEFGTTGAADTDRGLIDRIYRSYEYRMGR